MSDLFFLGLDGGGTKTKAVLIDGHAREVARATSGPSNYHSVGQETAQASLQAAMRQTLDQAAVTWQDVGAIGLGMAGVARPRDHRVLRTLLAMPGKVYTRVELVDRAYGHDHHVTERTIDSHIRRIRKKLGDAGAEDPIETVHGLGYRMRV